METQRSTSDGRARFCELLGASTLGLTVPVLAVMGANAELFVVARADRITIVAFATIVALGPATLGWLAETLLGVVTSRGAALAHSMIVGALTALAVALALRERFPDPGQWRMVAVGFGITWILIVLAHLELEAVRLWMRLVALAAPVIVLLFLTTSSVSALVLPARAAAGGAASASGAPVVLIVLDELPLAALLDGDGHIDTSAFPNLAALADDATWYRNTTTVHAFSPAAVPAIFTGRYPTDSALAPTAANYPESIFSLLGGAYEIRAFEQYDLCGTARCRRTGVSRPSATRELVVEGFGTVWDRIVPEAPPSISFDRSGPASLEAAERLVASIDGARHRLYATHLFLPHAPFQYTASGASYDDPDPYFGLVRDEELSALRWSSPATATLARVRHRAQLQFTDVLVGRILARLRARGIYDDALVIVTADHGIAFRAGVPHRVVTDQNATEILWVPLLVKAPFQTNGFVDDANVETVDILPIIGRHLGVTIPWTIDGVPPGSRPPGVKHFFTAWNGEHRDDGIVYDGRARFDALARSGESSGVVDPRFAAYSTGLHDELLGAAVGAHRMGGLAGVVTFESGPDVGGPRALVVRGRVEGIDSAAIAVAVNGTIAAIAQTYEMGRETYFAALVPDGLVRGGENVLDAFALDGATDVPVLRPLQKR